MEIFRLFGSIFIDNADADKKLDDVDKKSKGASTSLSGLVGAAGKAALALGAMGAAAAGGLIIKGVHSADELRKAMVSLESQTGASADQLAEFEDITKRLYGQNYGESFDDIADAMANIRQVTMASGQELEDMTRDALALRDTFEYDVAESTRTVNSLMANFGITGEQAYNLIAQGAQMGADKNGDLLDSLNEYAPQFQAMGFSADEFTSILISGATTGAFSIDKVGDAIKEFNIRAKDGSKATNEAFTALGLDADQMGAAFAAGGDSAQSAFSRVMEALGGLKDPMLQNQIGVQLFGTQFEDLGATAVLALGNVTQAADMNRGTMERINEIKFDSFGEAVSGIGRSLETGLIGPLSERVLPKLSELAAWIQGHMPEIQSAVESAMNIAIGVFEGFAGAIQWVIDNGNILLPVILGLTAAIAAQAIIDGVVKLYRTWQTATATQTTAQWLLNAALNANPLGIVALAIGALVAAGVALYQNWDKVREAAGFLWDKVKELWDILLDNPLLALVAGPIGGLIAACILVYKNFDTIKEKAGELWERIQEVFGFIRDFGVESWSELWNGFKPVINLISKGINTLIGGLNKINFDIPDWVPGIGGNSFGINIPSIPMLAKGTDYFEGGVALVGEEGPELVNLPRGSAVTPNRETEQMLGRPDYVMVKLDIDGKTFVQAVAQPIAETLEVLAKSSGRELGGMWT